MGPTYPDSINLLSLFVLPFLSLVPVSLVYCISCLLSLSLLDPLSANSGSKNIEIMADTSLILYLCSYPSLCLLSSLRFKLSLFEKWANRDFRERTSNFLALFVWMNLEGNLWNRPFFYFWRNLLTFSGIYFSLHASLTLSYEDSPLSKVENVEKLCWKWPYLIYTKLRPKAANKFET